MNVVKIGIEFLVIFLLIMTFYYFFSIRKYKKNNNLIPIEVSFIIVKNKLDIKKINVYKLIKTISLLTSIILAVSATLMIHLSNNIIISMLVGVSLSIVLAIIVYGFVGKSYKKKQKKRTDNL